MSSAEHVLKPKHRDFIAQQKLFFVSTAPLAADGLVNCSPKGLDSFRVLSDTEVAYQDLTGSGVETIAHLKENGRIVIMFCAFEGPPNILRLHGTGSVVEPGDVDFDALAALFPDRGGVRAYIRVRISRVADSCGYAVPRYTFVEERDVLDKWFDRKGDEGLRNYQLENNLKSLDGLPGLKDPEAN